MRPYVSPDGKIYRPKVPDLCHHRDQNHANDKEARNVDYSLVEDESVGHQLNQILSTDLTTDHISLDSSIE